MSYEMITLDQLKPCQGCLSLDNTVAQNFTALELPSYPIYIYAFYARVPRTFKPTQLTLELANLITSRLIVTSLAIAFNHIMTYLD